MPAQIAHLLSDQNQIARRALIDAAFARDDRRFEFGLLRPTPELSPAQEAVISESYRG